MKLIIYIKMDLALNNLQRLICRKTQQTKPNQINLILFCFIFILFYFIFKLKYVFKMCILINDIFSI